MIIEDYTLDKKFSDLQEGICFVMNSQYYMKIHIKYYDDYSGTFASYRNYAVNLQTGFAQAVNADEKVRLVTGRMIIE